MNVSSILTKKTHGEGWEISRKALSPAFSNSLLYKKLPEIHRQTAELTTIFDQHIAKNEALMDFSHWMVYIYIYVYMYVCIYVPTYAYM
jgi:cytochrome P450